MKINRILTINDTLRPDFWSNEGLNIDVSKKMIEIATKFFDDLNLEGKTLEDITFTGSLANYNWTKLSDIDLHLIIDFSKIDENYELVREFFNAKTALWNKTHKILIKDHEIEIYVQDINEKHHSTGVFSLKNDEWLVKPKRVEPKINTDMVKRKIKSFVDMIERVEDTYDDKDYKKSYDMSINLARKIKKFRKSGLEDVGVYSNENLTFKYLRNNGFIKTLYDTRNQSYDKMMSIDGNYAKKFKIFLSKDKNNDSGGFNALQEDEKFQKRVKKRHFRAKKRLLNLGNQKNMPPFTKNTHSKRSSSAPAEFGGS